MRSSYVFHYQSAVELLFHVESNTRRHTHKSAGYNAGSRNTTEALQAGFEQPSGALVSVS